MKRGHVFEARGAATRENSVALRRNFFRRAAPSDLCAAAGGRRVVSCRRLIIAVIYTGFFPVFRLPPALTLIAYVTSARSDDPPAPVPAFAAPPAAFLWQKKCSTVIVRTRRSRATRHRKVHAADGVV